ncbi:uncharacterized protein LOC110812148 isoform X2 [Carica papaya]|uniref:uncharacterized protein LOC110812148 isoform X2 n=1 Tax=Carica papaya TaxID=3649 RepID=UPI000B8C8772|nr:uncharacterized protein LOC110812148 isoform X2 [Carica papaya]
MESKRKAGSFSSSSSSSFTADLFGTKEPQPASSAGIFASIFPPPHTLAGRSTSSSDGIGSWKEQSFGNQAWSNKQGTPALCSDAARSCNIPNRERSPIFQEERVEPCHLSSSLYYGGQDIYSQSPSTHTSGSYPIFKKDGGEDDGNGNNSPGASRGNWWQGSLYY